MPDQPSTNELYKARGHLVFALRQLAEASKQLSERVEHAPDPGVVLSSSLDVLRDEVEAAHNSWFVAAARFREARRTAFGDHAETARAGRA